jgi:hypothetical protein
MTANGKNAAGACALYKYRYTYTHHAHGLNRPGYGPSGVFAMMDFVVLFCAWALFLIAKICNSLQSEVRKDVYPDGQTPNLRLWKKRDWAIWFIGHLFQSFYLFPIALLVWWFLPLLTV